jgi:hypothetical protein
VNEGWQRESERGPYELAPPRPRRGRGLLERLFGAARAPAQARAELPADEPADDRDPFELLGQMAAAPEPQAPGDPPEPAAPREPLQVALDAFNASEYPRRISGVARSLGAPRVSVRHAEHAASVIVIVVAWELCWYRYEVDLDDLEPVARATAQGTELDELAHEDLRENAGAGDSGALQLAHAS